MDEHLLSDRSGAQLPSHRRDRQPPSVATTTTCAAFLNKAFWASLALLLLCFLAWGPPGLVDLFTAQPPRFFVTIGGFSGLDDRAHRAFNLTLGVDNTGNSQICIDGNAVVLYGGVPLAVGQARELCVPRRGAADMAVAAASGGVGLPEALAEHMDGEKRADGAAHVEVRVVSPKHGTFLSCTAALGEEPARPYPCKKAILVDESDGVRPDGEFV
ncbi:hypothetical protein ACP4OV_004308 [Aristida adscensionis]